MSLCNDGMARPKIADIGDGLEIRSVAANMVNKQSRRDDKGWSSSLGVARRSSNNSSQK